MGKVYNAPDTPLHRIVAINFGERFKRTVRAIASMAIIASGLSLLRHRRGRGMTPDRWRQISRVYHDALMRGASDRAGFLHEACAGDDALQQEVASLLANESRAAGFLSEPALAGAAEIVTHTGGTRLTGRRIGVYQIRPSSAPAAWARCIARRDTKLKRHVAIKVLPDVVRARSRTGSRGFSAKRKSSRR